MRSRGASESLIPGDSFRPGKVDYSVVGGFGSNRRLQAGDVGGVSADLLDSGGGDTGIDGGQLRGGQLLLLAGREGDNGGGIGGDLIDLGHGGAAVHRRLLGCCQRVLLARDGGLISSDLRNQCRGDTGVDRLQLCGVEAVLLERQSGLQGGGVHKSRPVCQLIGVSRDGDINRGIGGLIGRESAHGDTVDLDRQFAVVGHGARGADQLPGVVDPQILVAVVRRGAVPLGHQIQGKGLSGGRKGGDILQGDLPRHLRGKGLDRRGVDSNLTDFCGGSAGLGGGDLIGGQLILLTRQCLPGG